MFPFLLFSQPFDYAWRNIGPDNFGGRTRALAITKSGKLYAGAIGGGLWESTDGGFRWQPVVGFNKVTNNPNINRCLSVSSIAIDPNNENIIYVGTGEMVFNYNTDAPSLFIPPLADLNTYQEGYLGYVGLPGQGVFKSEDGGKTFSNINATWSDKFVYPNTSFDTRNPFISIQKVAVAPNGRVFIGTHRGIFYSDDRLRTVSRPVDNYNAAIPTLRSSVDSLRNAPIMDIEFGNGGRVYVATHNNVFVSDDNGNTFTKVIGDILLPRNTADVFSNVPKRRMEVAVAPSNRNIVYILEVNLNGFLAGVWKSEDAANTWQQIAPRSTAIGTVPPNLSFAPLATRAGRGRGVYSVLLLVDPEDPHHIWMGGQQLLDYSPARGWASFTSSRTLPRFEDYVPANLHNAAIHPSNPNIIYFSSDNEIIRTTDGGKTFQLATGYYNTTPAISVAANLRDEILVSTQNTGLLQRFRQHVYDQKYRPILRTQRGRVRSSIFNPSNIVAALPGAILQRSLDDGENFERFFGFPENNPKYEFRNDNILKPNTQVPDPTDNPYPITAFVLDEVLNVKTTGNRVSRNSVVLNPQYLFYCTSQRIWLVKNPFNPFGSDSLPPPTWTAITRDKIDPNSYFSAITVSGDTTHTVFAGTTKGKIFRITQAHNPDTSAGSKFKVEDITPPNTPRKWITSLTVNPADPETLVVTYGGYDLFDEVDFSKNYRIYVSFDARTGQKPTFSPIHGSMPFMPIYSALFHPNPKPATPADTTLLLVGTEYGLYHISTTQLGKDNDDIEWLSANRGDMERVPVFDIFYKQWDYKYRCERYENNDPRSRCLENVNYLEAAKDPKIYIATFGRGVFESRLTQGNRTTSNFNPTPLQKDSYICIYPNPAQQTATVEFILDTPSDVNLEIYSLDGKILKAYSYSYLPAGLHREILDFSTLAKGTYVLKYSFYKGAKLTIKTTKLIIE
ncbi:MAG: T9SS type A sorting domain-containing protein [Bacteroidia bacterium]|nr:T9SS type A sorting domain-containing protein [Bacteroidia bacterium]MDW8159434.1 T9SS type A sorting domain-containing protein [Bacteroidia bacterium]